MVKNRKLLHRIMISRFWLTVFIIIVVLLSINAISLFVKRERVWKKVNQLEKEQAILLDRKEHIVSKNNNLEHGIGKEAILREKFNVVKNGEKIIILTEPKVDPLPPPPKPTFFQKIMDFLDFTK